MDIEVMVHEGQLKVLEIDARLPSQTPTAVFHACGINMVGLLAETVLGGRDPAVDRTPRQGCCYQHVRVAGGAVEVLGEHMMGAARPLRLIPGPLRRRRGDHRPSARCGRRSGRGVGRTLITLGASAAGRAARPGRRSTGWPMSTAWSLTPETTPGRETMSVAEGSTGPRAGVL